MWLATGGRGQNENSGLLLRGCENIDRRDAISCMGTQGRPPLWSVSPSPRRESGLGEVG